jgi:HK97 family phage major capsid protein
MKSLFKNYRHLTALALVISVAVIGAVQGVFSPGTALVIIGLWQLAQIAKSQPRRGVYVLSGISPEQVEEFQNICRDIQAEIPSLKGMGARFGQLEKLYDDLKGQVNRLKKSGLAGSAGQGIRWIKGVPFVSDDAARALVSDFLLAVDSLPNALPRLFPDEGKRASMLGMAKSFAGITQKAGGALSPTDIPLPTIYMPQIVELVFAYGQARQFATLFPLGAGTVKLPRLQAGEDTFGFLGAGTAGISQAIAQKEVSANLVTFTANKMGGIIRIPSELEEDTFIALGQFLARYIARQFAKMEDTTLFLADGSATYANIIGIGQYCANNPAYLLRLGAGNTLVTDATLANFRNLRSLVNPAVLFNMAANGQTQAAYYLHPSLEALLVTFNTIGQPLIYIPPRNGQPATLDGFPIRWIGISAANTGNAQPNAFMAFFGDLSFWYLGERGGPRVEVSREVFFATDELAMRALERIDIEAMAVDAMAAMQLPPA